MEQVLARLELVRILHTHLSMCEPVVIARRLAAGMGFTSDHIAISMYGGLPLRVNNIAASFGVFRLIVFESAGRR